MGKVIKIKKTTQNPTADIGHLKGTALKLAELVQQCVFRRSRPLIPTRSRPPYRFEAGHHSDAKPAI